LCCLHRARRQRYVSSLCCRFATVACPCVVDSFNGVCVLIRSVLNRGLASDRTPPPPTILLPLSPPVIVAPNVIPALRYNLLPRLKRWASTSPWSRTHAAPSRPSQLTR
jgi:hypothetical protein